MKLVVFDFDGTLFDTPTPDVGKDIYKQKTGTDWKYIGWWSKSESLDTKIFDIPLNKYVYGEYIKYKDEYCILVTGRMNNLRKEVEHILNINLIPFKEVHLNTGGCTYKYKQNLFEDKIKELNIKELIMYDDRDEHLIKFKEWSMTINCDITIVDIKTKKIFKNNI